MKKALSITLSAFSNEAHLNSAIRIKRKFVMTSSEAKNMSNKMTKDTVPQDFSLGLALVDAVPVLFFGATAIVAGTILESPLFVVGAVISFLSGAVKVLWKIIAALKKKNIWWMFVQMRIAMPIGLLVLIAGFVSAIKHTDFSLLLHTAFSLPYIVFFALGLLGMVLMSVFAFTLDGSKPKSNWIEQITNGISQAMFFIGVLLIKLK